ncbi:MAG TPA: hypothetical protein VNK04_08205 [Gemmataceae bacterium]|jgi:hypothetical protein|nr:hypothetical protein [Gemmataceae bacterium]
MRGSDYAGRRLAPGAALLVLLVGAGCSGEPAVVKVSGKVTHNGKPVPGLFLNFEPEKGRPSWAITDKEGRFTLSCFEDNDGAVVGAHRVYVSIKDEGQEEMRKYRSEVLTDKEIQTILKKYGKYETTPLRVDISRRTGDLEIKLD